MDDQKKALFESLLRAVLRNPGILDEIRRRIESNEIVDADGRPVSPDPSGDVGPSV